MFAQPPRDLACWQRKDEGSDGLHRLQKERVGGKVKMEKTVGLFQTILLASVLRAGASWVLFSGPGRLSYRFSHSHPTSHTHRIGSLSQISFTPLHESWPSTKSSSPGKEFPFSFLLQSQVLTKRKAQKLDETSELSSVQSA
jgi:hypothetical protein